MGKNGKEDYQTEAEISFTFSRLVTALSLVVERASMEDFDSSSVLVAEDFS
jgi:hypothetical protein